MSTLIYHQLNYLRQTQSGELFADVDTYLPPSQLSTTDSVWEVIRRCRHLSTTISTICDRFSLKSYSPMPTLIYHQLNYLRQIQSGKLFADADTYLPPSQLSTTDSVWEVIRRCRHLSTTISTICDRFSLKSYSPMPTLIYHQLNYLRQIQSEELFADADTYLPPTQLSTTDSVWEVIRRCRHLSTTISTIYDRFSLKSYSPMPTLIYHQLNYLRQIQSGKLFADADTYLPPSQLSTTDSVWEVIRRCRHLSTTISTICDRFSLKSYSPMPTLIYHQLNYLRQIQSGKLFADADTYLPPSQLSTTDSVWAVIRRCQKLYTTNSTIYDRFSLGSYSPMPTIIYHH